MHQVDCSKLVHLDLTQKKTKNKNILLYIPIKAPPKNKKTGTRRQMITTVTKNC